MKTMCSSKDEGIKKMWYIYIYSVYYLVTIMKEILPKTWMNLKDIMLNEIGKTEKDKRYMISLMCSMFKKKKG